MVRKRRQGGSVRATSRRSPGAGTRSRRRGQPKGEPSRRRPAAGSPGAGTARTGGQCGWESSRRREETGWREQSSQHGGWGVGGVALQWGRQGSDEAPTPRGSKGLPRAVSCSSFSGRESTSVPGTSARRASVGWLPFPGAGRGARAPGRKSPSAARAGGERLQRGLECR